MPVWAGVGRRNGAPDEYERMRVEPWGRPVRPRENHARLFSGHLAGGKAVANTRKRPWQRALLLLALAGILTLIAPAATGAPLRPPGGPLVPILFPLEAKIDWIDTFGAPRSGGRTHEGNDLMVPKMTPVLAVVDGTVDWLNLSGETSSYNGLPYYNLLLRGDDGNDYFYIHLNNDTPGTDDGQGGPANAYAPGLIDGTRVKAGDLLAWAGDSGNAEDTASHLHFEIHFGGYRNAVDPYESLRAAPTYKEWVAAGRPPLGTTTTSPLPTTTSTTTPATTTSTTTPVTTTTTPATPSTTATTAATGDLAPDHLPFTDVSESDWFRPELETAYETGIVRGSVDGRFHPYDELTRAHFAAFLVRALLPRLQTQGASSPTTVRSDAERTAGETVFADVPWGFWAYDEIQAAARHKLVEGIGDGTRFSPNAGITRAQMATMLARALADEVQDPSTPAEAQSFCDVAQDYWAAPAIAVVQRLGLVKGDDSGRFRPEDTTNRAHAVIVVARALVREASDWKR